MIQLLANPQRFMAFSRWAAPILGVLAAAFLGAAFWLAFSVPEDYQQGDTVRLLFLHPQLATVGMFAYACLAGSAFFGLVFRHSLADAAARAAAPLGAAFTFLFLLTGALWGKPMWGTWWVWDARLTSVVVLFLFYLGYIALRASIDDEAKAARAAAVLGLVGLVNLPIVKFSVDWFNTLHQPASLLRAGGPSVSGEFLAPLLVMMAAYGMLFAAVWLTGIRTEVTRRRVMTLRARAAMEA